MFCFLLPSQVLHNNFHSSKCFNLKSLCVLSTEFILYSQNAFMFCPHSIYLPAKYIYILSTRCICFVHKMHLYRIHKTNWCLFYWMYLCFVQTVYFCPQRYVGLHKIDLCFVHTHTVCVCVCARARVCVVCVYFSYDSDNYQRPLFQITLCE